MKAMMLAGTLALLTGAAASSPAKAQSSDVDYGACPKTHLEQAKAAFRLTLLGRYNNFHVWPPQKFSYQTPARKGGQTVAGYLVPVQIDPSVITGLWALLFKNDEIVKKFEPSELEDLAIPPPVISIAKDQRDWVIGNSGEIGNITFQEWVVRGETAQNWQERLTAETHNNQPAMLGSYLIVMRQSLGRRYVVKEQTISESLTEILMERTLVGRAENRDEYQIARVVVGPRSLTEIVYARSTPFDDATKARWIEILGRAQILGDC